MIITTANIGRGVTPAEAQANIHRIRKAQPGSIIGWQEIDGADTPNEHHILLDVYGRRYHHAGFPSAVPITVPLPWTITHQRVTPAMDALPPVGAARKITEAVASYDLTQRRMAVLNTHMTRTPPGNEQAEHGWDKHHELLRERVAHYVDRDIPVVFTGDVNKVGFGKIHPRQVVVVAEHVDRIIVVPTKSWRWEVRSKGSVSLSIDIHDAQWAKLRLRKQEK